MFKKLIVALLLGFILLGCEEATPPTNSLTAWTEVMNLDINATYMDEAVVDNPHFAIEELSNGVVGVDRDNANKDWYSMYLTINESMSWYVDVLKSPEGIYVDEFGVETHFRWDSDTTFYIYAGHMQDNGNVAGDEIAIINIYEDLEKTKLLKTYSVIL